ncbi:unnamed protein product, partial [Amoebophrya sp. A120]|eukprot:GSA120T00014457001.1
MLSSPRRPEDLFSAGSCSSSTTGEINCAAKQESTRTSWKIVAANNHAVRTVDEANPDVVTATPSQNALSFLLEQEMKQDKEIMRVVRETTCSSSSASRTKVDQEKIDSVVAETVKRYLANYS